METYSVPPSILPHFMDLDFELDIPAAFDEDALLMEPLYLSLYEQRCVLILGPNVATLEEGGAKEPMLHRFSRVLANHLQKSGKTYDAQEAHNLPYIALRWLHEIKGVQPVHLRGSLKKFYAQFAQRVPDVFTQLAKLPFSLTINTAPDDYLHQAFTQAGKKGTLLHYNYHRNQTPLIPTISEQSPLVYNLFGEYQDEESLVITKEDEIAFIHNMLRNVSELPNEIIKHLDKEKTYLFLGFDSRTWHLPLLLRSLKPQQESSAFYIDTQDTAPMLRMFYEDAFNFNFVNQNIEGFLQKLTEGYQQWTRNRPAAPPPAQQVYIERPQPDMLTGKSKILVLTSNPKDTAFLEGINKEIKAIQGALRQAPLRDKFSADAVLDVGKMDLLGELLHHHPQIVHFSGHGVGQGGLLFSTQAGYSDSVDGEQLAQLFRQFEGISCVILNACYSETQAQTISQFIPNVIGTDNAIGDDVALAFTEGFYLSLFAGKSYEAAFFMAMAHVGIGRFPDGGRPVYYKDGKRLEK